MQPLSRALGVVAAGGLAVLVVVLVAGGFVVDVGPVRVSSRRVVAPLVIATLPWFLLALRGRQTLAGAASALLPSFDRHATGAACVLAASCAGVGVAFGTYAASGADPAGYLSHAERLVRGSLTSTEPLAVSLAPAEGTWLFVPLGYRPGATTGSIVPGYPLGLPALMASAGVVSGDAGPYLVVPLLGAAFVLACFGLGVRLHSRLAGLVAAVLAATSPIVLFQVVQPMSDVPAAAVALLAVLAALGATRASAAGAGALFALAVAIRPNVAPLGLVVAACAAGWPRRWTDGRRSAGPAERLMLVAAGGAPVLMLLAVVQWRLYGSPFSTGYGGLDQYFEVANVWTNVWDYARRIDRGEGPALVLALAALLTRLVTAWTRPFRAPPVSAAVWMGAAVSTATLAVYLPYGVFPDWSYLRFLLPMLGAGFVLAGALVACAVGVLPAPVGGLALVAALAWAGANNVSLATREQAFDVHRYESRYRSVGRYLAAVLPADAVVVASQHSGSAAHYTGRPVVRWDVLGADLDGTLDALRRHGRHPVLVAEDWERPVLGARFPDSAAARLDWAPLADIGETTHVLVLDPADRSRVPARPTDRFR